MVSRLALAAIFCLAFSAAPAHAVGKKKDVSWGKPGISFVDYRADAIECSNRAYGVDVQMKPFGPWAESIYSAGVMPPAIWTSLTPGRIMIYTTHYVDAYRHAAWVDTVEQLQAVVDQCLVDRGYRKFRLTPSQMSVLRTLKPGSPERQHFLYSLGSSAEILASQPV